ncbi:MAG: FtsX-like permease family protein [Bacillota bacterium]
MSDKTRTILVMIAMIIGVTGVGAVLNARAILSREMDVNYMRTNPASATLWVEGIDDETVRKVKSMPGILDAEAGRTIAGRVRSDDGDEKKIVMFVVENFSDMRIGTFEPEDGKRPPEKGDILVERAAMQVINAKTGDKLDIKLPGGPYTEWKLAGTVHAPALPPAWMEDEVFSFITLETYQQLGGDNGFNELKFVVSENRMDKTYVQRVTYKLKDWLEQNGKKVWRIEIPEPGKHPHATQMQTLLFLLGAFGIIALILSAVIVANVISALLSQQIRQIGMMKAVGAKSGQIAAIYLSFVIILGIAAIALAVPAAVLAGRAYSSFAANMLNFQIFSYRIPLWTFLSQIAVGLLLPLLAAVYFIVKGSRITVIEALQDYGVALNNKNPNTRDSISSRFGGISRPFLLSIRNTFRKKGRLLFTLGVLSIGGALFITAMNVSASMNTSSAGVIKSYRFDASIGLARPYKSTDIEESVKKVPGIKDVEVWGGSQAVTVHADGMSGDNFKVLAIPSGSKLVTSVKPNTGRWLAQEDTNAVVLNQRVLNKEPDTKVGDTIILRINGKDSVWKVVGVVQEMMSEPKAYVNQEYFQQLTGQEGFGQNVVITTGNRDSKNIEFAVRDVEKNLDSAGFEITSVVKVDDIRRKIDGHLLLLAVMLIMMSFLGVVVGGLGLSTTMSINVLERTREIGIMRAVGASTHSIFRIIVGEGVLIGLLSWVFAAAIATPASIFISYMFGTIFFETPLKIALSPTGVFIWLVLAMLFAALSSLYPAYKASRMSVREVLSYE